MTACRSFLPPEHWAPWLGEAEATPSELKAMLKPCPSERMTLWAVNRWVGNVQNDSPDLFEPLRDAV